MSSSTSTAVSNVNYNNNNIPEKQTNNVMSMNKKNKIGSTSPGGRRMPSPDELIKHYESQGMDSKQASVKVINDLQKALFRIVTTSSKEKTKQQPQQQLDVINGRLMRIDMKLDTKPGYSQIFGLGLASAAAFRGFETCVFPQLANIWNAVRSTTDPKP